MAIPPPTKMRCLGSGEVFIKVAVFKNITLWVVTKVSPLWVKPA